MIESGTSIVVIAVPGVVVVAGDHLNQVMQPESQGVMALADMGPKIVLWGNEAICGSAGLNRADITLPVSNGRTESFKYEFHSWLPPFNPKAIRPGKTYARILAKLIREKAAHTFKKLNAVMKSPQWQLEQDRPNIITFLTAGLAGDMPEVFTMPIKINWQYRALSFPPAVQQIPANVVWPFVQVLGDLKSIDAAMRGVEPQHSTFETLYNVAFPSVRIAFPDAHDSIHRMTARAIALVRTESKFNPEKVGDTVTVIVKQVAQPALVATFSP